MDIGVISVRYAKALLQFAKENGEDEKVYDEVKSLAQSFVAVPQLRATLLNPTLTKEKKAEIMTAAAVGKGNASKSLFRFFELVIKQQRVEYMQFIAQSYIKLYQDDKNMTQGHLTVACDIPSSVVNNMKDLVQKRSHKNVNFEVTLDKAIKGGFILEYETYRLDASVRSRLSRIYRTLTEVG